MDRRHFLTMGAAGLATMPVTQAIVLRDPTTVRAVSSPADEVTDSERIEQMKSEVIPMMIRLVEAGQRCLKPSEVEFLEVARGRTSFV